MFRFIISTVGFIFLWKKLRDFIYFLWNVSFQSQRDLKSTYGRGTYVVVTGGSDGIGKSFAKSFASEGFNLFLVARDPQKLAETKRELDESFPATDVRVHQFDFETVSNQENFNLIQAWNLDDPEIDVSIVVSNVGVSQGNFFDCLDEDLVKKVVKVNMASQAVLSLNFARYFARRKLKSAFIQTSSISALNPFPFYDLYGATKAFNRMLSRSLAAFDAKIDWYCFAPSFVSTKLNHFRSGALVVTPDQAVQGAMVNVGSQRAEFYGHWKHELLALAFELIPDIVLQHRLIRDKMLQVKKRGFSKD